MKNFAQYKFLVVAAVIVVVVIGIIVSRQFKNQISEVVSNDLPKAVKVMTLKSLKSGNKLEVEGTVKPESKVDIVALANGTVRSVNFKLGDKVGINQVLGGLSDSQLATSYSNSSLNYSNISQNVALTRTLTDEGVKQASLGTDRAKEVYEQAKIATDNAKQNLDNAKNLQTKGKEDQQNNALVAYNNFLNVSGAALDQSNYILKADGNSQLDGINDTLSVLNSQALSQAKERLLTTKDSYRKLSVKKYSTSEATEALRAAVELLSETKSVVDGVVKVLDNTISSSKFSDSALSMQRSSFVTVRANVVSTLSAAQANLQGLQNIDLINKRELDGLNAAVRAATNQLAQAQLGIDNAQMVLNNSKQNQNQQLLLSKSSLDNARGQMNLVGTQLADLTVKSPIAGEITAKTVELGAEVRIGQKLGEVSQTNMVKIVLNMSPEDADLVKLGQKATVNGKLVGTVSNINPSADAISKKVLVEVVVENKLKLKPETLAKVQFILADNPQARQQYKVPLAAVTVAQNESYIFIAGGKEAKKVGVELLEVDGDWATVKVALPGDVKVVIDGNKTLSDGSLIEIK